MNNACVLGILQSNFYSFKKHRYRKHHEHLEMIGPSAAVTSLPQNPSNPFHDIKYMYKEPTSSCETVVPTIVYYNHVTSQEANGTFPSQVKRSQKRISNNN